MNLKKNEDGFFLYDFTVDKSRYRGNTYLADKNKAKKFVAEKISDIKHKPVEIKDILLEDAWTEYLKSPLMGSPCKKRLANERGKFLNFLDFLESQHIKTLNQVTADHAIIYFNQLKTDGKTVKSGFKKLSPFTLNEYIIVCSKVFKTLKYANPFRYIKKLKKNQTDREPFTPKEIDLMLAKSTGMIRHLIYIGLFTGLRKGDICELRNSEINLVDRVITRKQNKTGTIVRIPICNYLYAYLSKVLVPHEFVSTELTHLYRGKEAIISIKFKEFLDELGIKNTIKSDTGRRISIKDIHSLRHTFAYTAARNNIPLAVVQAILGHSNEATTKIYTKYASDQDMKQAVGTVEANLSKPDSKEIKNDDLGDVLSLVSTMDLSSWQAIKRIILRKYKSNNNK